MTHQKRPATGSHVMVVMMSIVMVRMVVVIALGTVVLVITFVTVVIILIDEHGFVNFHHFGNRRVGTDQCPGRTSLIRHRQVYRTVSPD